MISDKLNDALNGQINAELYSSYLYLSMAAWFSARSLPGFANWMRCQVQEELFHATKMFDYVNERGGTVVLEAIAKPDDTWDSPLTVLKQVARHEAHVTKLINDLVNCALDERDHASNIFLQWYVTEQVEEEASVGEALNKLKMIGKDSAGMFAMDLEMGKRIFTPPAAA